MEIGNIILNDEENQFCLDEISKLMDCDAGVNSKEGVILRILATVVEGYEKKHYPISENEKLSDLEFQKIIKSAVLNSAWSLGDFIDTFDVSKGTVDRWTRGKSLPLMGARPPIVSWLKDKMSREL